MKFGICKKFLQCLQNTEMIQNQKPNIDTNKNDKSGANETAQFQELPINDYEYVNCTTVECDTNNGEWYIKGLKIQQQKID